jgi:hypothetical protein
MRIAATRNLCGKLVGFLPVAVNRPHIRNGHAVSGQNLAFFDNQSVKLHFVSPIPGTCRD